MRKLGSATPPRHCHGPAEAEVTCAMDWAEAKHARGPSIKSTLGSALRTTAREAIETESALLGSIHAVGPALRWPGYLCRHAWWQRRERERGDEVLQRLLR
jgi:hypothetical protein